MVPAADVVLLPLCAVLSLIALVAAGISWRRRRPGRVIQAVGLALLPIALYLVGLLRLVWDGVIAVVRWAGQVLLSPVVWLGLGMLGLALVLFVTGSVLVRRRRGRAQSAVAAPTGARSPAVTKGTGRRAPADTAPEDPEMAEIEALLKSRGIS